MVRIRLPPAESQLRTRAATSGPRGLDQEHLANRDELALAVGISAFCLNASASVTPKGFDTSDLKEAKALLEAIEA